MGRCPSGSDSPTDLGHGAAGLTVVIPKTTSIENKNEPYGGLTVTWQWLRQWSSVPLPTLRGNRPFSVSIEPGSR